MSQATVQTISAAATGSGSIIIDKPSGTVDGDLMIAQIVDGANFTNDYTTVPSGWTRIEDSQNDNDTSGGTGMDTWYKVASSEGANYTWSKALSGEYLGRIVRIDGQSSGTPLNTSSEGEDNTSDTTATGTAITNTGYSLLLMFIGTGTVSQTVSGYTVATSDPTWTESYDDGANANSIAMAYGLRPEVTSTGAVTATLGTTSKSITHLVAINSNVNINVPTGIAASSGPTVGVSVSQTVAVPTAVMATSGPVLAVNTVDKPVINNTNKSSASIWTNTSKS